MGHPREVARLLAAAWAHARQAVRELEACDDPSLRPTRDLALAAERRLYKALTGDDVIAAEAPAQLDVFARPNDGAPVGNRVTAPVRPHADPTPITPSPRVGTSQSCDAPPVFTGQPAPPKGKS